MNFFSLSLRGVRRAFPCCIPFACIPAALCQEPAPRKAPAATWPGPAEVPALVAPYVYSSRRDYVAPELPDAPAEWVGKSFAWAGIMLDFFPPAVNEPPVRRAVLQRLDDIFHLQDASHRPQVRAFLQSQVEKALVQMEAPSADTRPRIWKLYNDGFVVRVDGLTYGFDLIPGVPGRPRGMPSYVGAPSGDCTMTDAQMQRLVAQVDALFVSHLHYDHANQRMAEAFLAAGKPVVVPPKLWSETPIAQKLLYAPRSVTDTFEVPLAGKAAKLRVLAYPGHQDAPVLNNVYLVTSPSGFTVQHCGDQSWPGTKGGDYAWLDEIGNEHKVDLLFVDCWYGSIQRLIRSVNPALVITGHEDELGHAIDHREDYAQTYEHLFGCPYPFVLMTWGETFVFNR
jgi:L-ascorbate metabolism protein UlaG (beta-lactamase superfamily)